MDESFKKQLKDLFEINETRRLNITKRLDELESKLRKIQSSYLIDKFEPELHIIIANLLSSHIDKEFITESKTHVKINLWGNTYVIQYRKYCQRKWNNVNLTNDASFKVSIEILKYINNNSLTAMIYNIKRKIESTSTSVTKYYNEDKRYIKNIEQENLINIHIGYKEIKIKDIKINDSIALFKYRNHIRLNIFDVEEYFFTTYNDYIYEHIMLLIDEAEKDIDIALNEFLKFENEIYDIIKEAGFMDILISHKL